MSSFSGSLSVKPGTKITVTNKDSVDHNVTATGGQFKTSDIGQNKTATFTAPTKAGSYAFPCTIHPQMVSTVTVK